MAAERRESFEGDEEPPAARPRARTIAFPRPASERLPQPEPAASLAGEAIPRHEECAAAERRREFLLVGLNHRTAPLALREAVAVPKDALGGFLDRVRRDAGLAEAAVLSTCNRVEVYGVGDPGASERVAELLLARGRRPRADLERIYRRVGEDAVRQAFRVAAGLDSLVVGEPQILGQVKEAYQAAQEAGALGARLNALHTRTLSVAKRVRTETGIGRHAVSVSHVAVELARKIFGDLRERNVLLVGAGKMCRIAAARLVKEGARISVLGRTAARAAELAAELGGRPAPFHTLLAELAATDIVIAGTAAPGTVIGREEVDEARRGRGNRPLFLIDIAVPRDIDPEVRSLSGVFLYDVDDLRSVADANLRERRRQAAGGEALVEREVREFLEGQRAFEAVPLVVELRRRGDEIRRAELEKARRRLGPLTPEQERAVDAVTAAIVSKLLHAPTVCLKTFAQEGRSKEEMRLLREALGLP